MATTNRNRINDALPDAWQNQMRECQQATTDAIRENPLAATIAVFGVGFLVGTAIGAALGDEGSSHRDHLATSLGRRMLHAVNELVPDNLQQHLRT